MTTLTPRQIVVELAQASWAQHGWLVRATGAESCGENDAASEAWSRYRQSAQHVLACREELRRTGEVPSQARERP